MTNLYWKLVFHPYLIYLAGSMLIYQKVIYDDVILIPVFDLN
jgi:hypothetical protein